MRGEFVDVHGTRLYYYAAGSRGDGDPVLFLHGFPGSSHAWRLMVPLMPAGRRLIVADLMGCGRSDGPGDGPADLRTQAALVTGLLDDLRADRVAIVAHGTGGGVAQAIASEAPSRVTALALMSCPAFDARLRIARLARLAAPAARFVGPSLLASFVHGSAVRGYVNRDEGRRSLDVALRAYPTHLGAGALVAHLAALHDPAVAACGARLDRITAPTLVLWGADDPFISPAVGERLRRAIPGATLEVIPGARHFIHEEAPERCARAVAALLARTAPPVVASR